MLLDARLFFQPWQIQSEADSKSEAKRLFLLARDEDGPVPDPLGKIHQGKTASFVIKAKSSGVFAGADFLKHARELLPFDVNFLSEDGKAFQPGDHLVEGQGDWGELLRWERPILNILHLASGIATQTSLFCKDVDRVVLDTRKTLPGLRFLSKYAVRVGGGWNHRSDLHSLVMVKDTADQTNLASMVKELKSKKNLIEIEVDQVSKIEEVIELKPDVIMLDNMNDSAIEDCIRYIEKSTNPICVEISGNITRDRLVGSLRKISPLVAVSTSKIQAPALVDLSWKIL